MNVVGVDLNELNVRGNLNSNNDSAEIREVYSIENVVENEKTLGDDMTLDNWCSFSLCACSSISWPLRE